MPTKQTSFDVACRKCERSVTLVYEDPIPGANTPAASWICPYCHAVMQLGFRGRIVSVTPQGRDH